MFVVGLGSVDSFEQVALGSERGIAKHRAVQIQAIRQLDQSQVDLVDGCRSMTDWVALSARCKSFHRAGSGVPGQSQRCGSGGDAGSRGDRSGPGGQIIEKALFQRADELPTAPGVDRAQKLADAFTLICTDNLTGSSEGRAVTVAEVFIDATLAAPTNGEAGVTLSGNPGRTQHPLRDSLHWKDPSDRYRSR